MKTAASHFHTAAPAQAIETGGGAAFGSEARSLPHPPTTCYAMEVRDALSAELRRMGPRFSTPQFLVDWGDGFQEWFGAYNRNARQLYDALRAQPTRRLTISYRTFVRHVRTHRLRLARPAPVASAPTASAPLLAPSSTVVPPPPPSPSPVFAPAPGQPLPSLIVQRVTSVRSVIPPAVNPPPAPHESKTLDDILAGFVNNPKALEEYVEGLRDMSEARNAERSRLMREAREKGLPPPVFTD